MKINKALTLLRLKAYSFIQTWAINIPFLEPRSASNPVNPNNKRSPRRLDLQPFNGHTHYLAEASVDEIRVLMMSLLFMYSPIFLAIHGLCQSAETSFSVSLSLSSSLSSVLPSFSQIFLSSNIFPSSLMIYRLFSSIGSPSQPSTVCQPSPHLRLLFPSCQVFIDKFAQIWPWLQALVLPLSN